LAPPPPPAVFLVAIAFLRQISARAAPRRAHCPTIHGAFAKKSEICRGNSKFSRDPPTPPCFLRPRRAARALRVRPRNAGNRLKCGLSGARARARERAPSSVRMGPGRDLLDFSAPFAVEREPPRR